MISSEVQRTLVKSPPELWAEISDPESLARHLGEFGEIRITRVQPEQKVEWEADEASGTVVIKPSGWGTKVKLTVTRELAEPEPADEGAGDAEAEQQPTQEESPALDVSPVLAQSAARQHDAGELDAEPELTDEAERDFEQPLGYEQSERTAESEPEPEPEPELAVEPEPFDRPERSDEPEPIDEPESEARRGFFARLFRRRRTRTVDPAPVATAEPEPMDFEEGPQADGLAATEPALLDERAPASEQVLLPELPVDAAAADAPEAEAQALGEQQAPAPEQEIGSPGGSPVEDESAQAEDPAAAPALAQELATAEVTAVLTGVLDRLGAAHHRPFSRA
jgi:hypothetical protein